MKPVKKLQRVFTFLWGLWLLFFAVVEAAALSNKKKGDSLSEHVWYLRGRHKWAVRVLVGGFLAWLAYHLLFQ